MSGQPLLVARVAAHPTAVAAFRPVAVAQGTVLWHERARRSALGVARRLALPQGLSAGDDVLAVQDALAGAEVVSDAAPAGAPLSAIGALPFDGTAGGELVVPATLLVEPAAAAGGAVAVLAGTDGAALVRAAGAWERGIVGDLPGVHHAGPPATGTPERFTLSSPGGHEAFRELVRCAVDDIRAGSLKKVVLVREVLVEADRPFPRSCLVERLQALYPSCTTFSVGGFVGASPELLVARAGVAVRAHPLAGTIGRSGDPATDARAEAALLASPKERSEHRVVVDAIVAVLRPLCDELDVPATPQIVELRNVSHLGSLLTGRLRAGAGRVPGALELVAALHPTPAVAGTPTADALAWIDKHEGVDRGPYAGPVGWVDAEGDGEWFVGIRAGLFDGGCARLFAGVGVVADSDPDAELAETQLKLQALLAAAVRP